MIRIAFGLTLAISGAAAWLALDSFAYLAPYRDQLLRSHGWTAAAFAAALTFDLFALLYLACRRLGLGDAGRKLRRLDSELRHGKTFDEELAQRLREQEEGQA